MNPATFPGLLGTDPAKLISKLESLLADPLQEGAYEAADVIEKRLGKIQAEANFLATQAFALKSGMARAGFAHRPRDLPEGTWAILEASSPAALAKSKGATA